MASNWVYTADWFSSKQRWMDAYSQYMECHVSEWTNNVQIQRNLWGSHGGYVETSQLTPSFSLKSTRDEVDINKRKSRLPTKLRIGNPRMLSQQDQPRLILCQHLIVAMFHSGFILSYLVEGQCYW